MNLVLLFPSIGRGPSVRKTFEINRFLKRGLGINLVFALFIAWIQRGCVPGRNSILNILELETFSRVFIKATRSSLPPAIFVFFDLLAAFPTLAIACSFKVLEASGAPLGFRNYVESMCIDLLHFVQYRGAMVLFGLVTQGVVQGCPLASLL